MKKITITNLCTLLVALLFSTVLINPASAQATSDYDKDTDFSKYKTYSFAGWQKDCEKQLTDFDQKRITDALTSEFESRGVNMVDGAADATVTIYIVLQNETSTTAYTDYTGGFGFAPRWGWGAGMGMGTATTTLQQDNYIEGTLVVDMYDSNSKKLVWQGVIKSQVNENPQKREKTIPKNIRKLMKGYPVKPAK
jgi:hypothetical protein